MDPVTGLSLGRMAIGVLTFAQPATVARVFGLDAADPHAAFLARLFASRDLALGALTLLATGSARRNLVLAGIAVDLADGAVGVMALRTKSVSPRTGALFAGGAFAAVLTGVGGLRGR